MQNMQVWKNSKLEEKEVVNISKSDRWNLIGHFEILEVERCNQRLHFKHQT